LNRPLRRARKCEAKLDHEFLPLNPSTPCPSTTPKHKSKLSRKVTGPRVTTPTSKQPPLSNTYAPMNVHSTPISVSLSLPTPSPFRPQRTPISVSSSSPSPFHPQGTIIDLMDSNSSDMYRTPVKCHKVAVKHEQHTPPLTAIIRGEKRQWPSDYPVLDHIMAQDIGDVLVKAHVKIDRIVR
jgi:hypothetical protein